MVVFKLMLKKSCDLYSFIILFNDKVLMAAKQPKIQLQHRLKVQTRIQQQVGVNGVNI